MSTKWDTAAIPFLGGIDTKSDAKAAPPTKLVELENGVFTKRGSVRKRHGYDLTKAIDINGAAVTGEVLATRGDSMVLLDSHNAYTYQDGKASWVDMGYYNRVVLESKEVEASTESRTLGSRAEANGITVRAWISDAGETEIEISVTETGAILGNITDATIASGAKPQCVRVGHYLHVVFAVGGSTNLMSLPINTFKPTDAVAADAVVIASDLHVDEVYDICENSNRTNALFSWYSNGSDELRWGRLLPSGSTESKNGVSSPAVVSISLAVNSEDMLLVACMSTVLVFTRIDDVNGSMTPSGDGGEVSVSGYDKASACITDTKFAIAIETTVASQEDQTLDLIHGLSSNMAGGTYTSDAIRHSVLASHGFTVDDKMYVFVKHETHNQVQNSNYLMELHTGTALAATVGQINLGNATPTDTSSHLPRFALTDDSKISGILPTRKNVASTNGNAFLYLGLSEITVDPQDATYTAVEAGDALYVPGGIVWHLDGKEPVEASFVEFPELDIEFGSTDPADHAAVDVSVAGAGAPNGLVTGTYGYKVFYEWTNASGEIMRSSAIPFSVLNPGNFKVVLTIPTLFHTLKGLSNAFGARDDISIAVYRTAIGLNKYHRCSGTDPTVTTGDNHYLFNDRDADTVTFTDDMPDAVLLTKEIDPTIVSYFRPRR